MRKLGNLLRDTCGVFAIETAVVAPVLALMAIGAFEVGTMVSRQQELQSAASEAEGIVLAMANGGVMDLAGVKNVIETSLDPAGTRDNLTINMEYRIRCDTAAELVGEGTACPDPDKPAYMFVLLEISDRYDPVWTQFGFSDGFDYDISRTIQVR